jgi:hypothetical protein
MMHNARSMLEDYLVERAAMTRVEAQALSDEQVCEHVLAVNGYAVVSIEIADEIERIEALGYNVPLARLDAVIGAIYSGALAEYRRPLALV